MIQNPHFYNFKNSEIVQYITQVIDIVAKEDVASLLLTTPVDALSSKLTALKEAYKKTQGSSITKELQVIDERRDRAIVGIRGVISNYAYHYVPSTVVAAERLLAVISKHGVSIARRGYNEETLIIESIIKEIENSSELTAAVETLNVSAWLLELKNTNTLFNTKYIERVEESVLNSATSFTDLRLETVKLYNDLLAHISAHNTLSENVAYKELLDRIDNLTTLYHQTIDNRINSGSNKEAEVPENTADNDTEEDTTLIVE